MDNVITQAQQILDELTSLSPKADEAEATGDFSDYDEATADLGEDALHVLPALMAFTRLAARFAVLTSSAFENWSCDDLECVMTDILTDLRHYASHNGVDFEQANEWSAMHFDVESSGE